MSDQYTNKAQATPDKNVDNHFPSGQQLEKKGNIISKRLFLLVTFVMLLSASLIITKIAVYQNQKVKQTIDSLTKQNNSADIQQVPSVTPVPGSTSVQNEEANEPLAEYSSADKTFTVSFYSANRDDVTKCSYKLINNATGTYIDLAKIFPNGLITCHEGMGNFGSSFRQWSDHYLVFSENQNRVDIFNADNSDIITHQYDSEFLSFAGVDNNLNYWLYRVNDNKTEQSKFVLMDNQNKKIWEEVILDQYPFTDFDPVNNGFLFIYKILNQNATQEAKKNGENIGSGLYQTYFDYLQVSKLTKVNLLTTSAYALFGRGCYREKIDYKIKQIVVNSNNAGCLSIDPKYYTDNKIVINLP